MHSGPAWVFAMSDTRKIAFYRFLDRLDASRSMIGIRTLGRFQPSLTAEEEDKECKVEGIGTDRRVLRPTTA